MANPARLLASWRRKAVAAAGRVARTAALVERKRQQVEHRRPLERKAAAERRQQVARVAVAKAVAAARAAAVVGEALPRSPLRLRSRRP
jgi:hypothetical protein